MSKWLVLTLLLLSYVSPTASGAAPRDRDHDRLPDRWEKRHDLSTSRKSARRDPDHDGLRNLPEYRLRTHPRKRDTDGDGLGDGAEVRRYRTNPRKRDTDGDGYRDGIEVGAGTNPRNGGSQPPGSSTPPTPSTPLPPLLPSGFPGASSTGVPAGVTLTASGGLSIGVAGTVIDGREITGQVVVNAPNVTIRRSRIRSNAMWVIDNNSTGLVVEDSEIINRPVAGQPNCHNGIGNSNFTIRRSEITGCENAADIGGGNATFEDNYVHDLDTAGPSHVWGNDPHTDGIQVAGDNVVIRHNWIDPTASSGATAAIIMDVSASSPNRNVRIEDNYLDGRGSSYALYAPRVQTSGNVINRNRMLKGYGYTACVRLGVTVAEFNENRDAGTGALIGPDNGAGGGCTN